MRLVALGQTRQQVDIVEYREGRRERAAEVLDAVEIDPVLDADSRIVLSEHGGRHPDQAYSAVGHGGDQPDRVQHGATADRDHVRVTVDPVLEQALLHLLDEEQLGLDPFAARHR